MNNIFYIIAAGPSVLDVTKEEWKYLEDKNTITFARVPIGGIKTKYYFSIEGYTQDEDMLLHLKHLGYLDTRLLLYVPDSMKLARKLGFRKIRKVLKRTFYFMPSRRPWFVDEKEPPHKFRECRAKNFHQPLFRFRGQLTAVINACVILGATEIRLIGVDLNSQWAFYDNVDYVKSICDNEDSIDRFKKFLDDYTHGGIERSYEHIKHLDPDKVHTVDMVNYEPERFGDRGIRGMSDVIEWVDKEMVDEGMEGIFITNKKSKLYKGNKLRYKEIMD